MIASRRIVSTIEVAIKKKVKSLKFSVSRDIACLLMSTRPNWHIKRVNVCENAQFWTPCLQDKALIVQEPYLSETTSRVSPDILTLAFSPLRISPLMILSARPLTICRLMRRFKGLAP